ncbi:hypothetical protein VN97_g11321 [Penicillium thymicola]|uniref:Uncharacterized protein n=1 Tax=Penicillium thymicola TaxID=293382 RepID=A0AAI9T851_PENTH|nr:hypothetical protein VN97_g11321 [Penicillium thymicola]
MVVTEIHSRISRAIPGSQPRVQSSTTTNNKATGHSKLEIKPSRHVLGKRTVKRIKSHRRRQTDLENGWTTLRVGRLNPRTALVAGRSEGREGHPRVTARSSLRNQGAPNEYSLSTYSLSISHSALSLSLSTLIKAVAAQIGKPHPPGKIRLILYIRILSITLASLSAKKMHVMSTGCLSTFCIGKSYKRYIICRLGIW